MNHFKNFAKQALAVVGAIAAAVVLFSVIAPKAAHAAVAALVEVANTPSNPVPNADVSRSAANLVNLYCTPVDGCFQLGPGGVTDLRTKYTVPAGQNLVVTDVLISTTAGTGDNEFGISGTGNGPYAIGPSFEVLSDGLAHSFHLQGFVYPSGSPIVPFGDGGYAAFVGGYLTPN